MQALVASQDSPHSFCGFCFVCTSIHNINTELTETSDNSCGFLTAGAVCSLCSTYILPYFLSSADFFIGSVVQMDGEAELPQMELVLQGKAHLAQVA